MILMRNIFYPFSLFLLLSSFPLACWDECIKGNFQPVPLLEHNWAYMVLEPGLHVVR